SMGGQFGPHSYDPGIMAGSLVFWGTPLPHGSGMGNVRRGIARLRAQNLCSAFDGFTGPNSLDPTHSLGIFSAVIDSLMIERSIATSSRRGISDPTNQLRGDFLECSATIEVSVTAPPETGPGFHFESDPATTHTDFAQFGIEHNGVFF